MPALNLGFGTLAGVEKLPIGSIRTRRWGTDVWGASRKRAKARAASVNRAPG
jgi:hypothetical protein